jgi:hypothetical protein
MTIQDAINIVQYADEDADFYVVANAYQTLIDFDLIWDLGAEYAQEAQYLIDFGICYSKKEAA